MKTTRYFESTRLREDRRAIVDDWVLRVIQHPVIQTTQADGRIRRWAPISEAGGRVLRVVTLEDGETVHNAFFDRSFTP